MVVEVRAIGAYNVIAIYSGTEGGTRNTIEYAMQKGIEIYYAKGWEMPPANKGERR